MAHANSVERTRPGQINLLDVPGFRSDSLDSTDEFFGGSEGNRQQEDTVRINPADDKMRRDIQRARRTTDASSSGGQISLHDAACSLSTTCPRQIEGASNESA